MSHPSITIDVKTGDSSYPVIIQPGLLKQAGDVMAPYARDGRLVVISDENVWRLHGPAFAASLAERGLSCNSLMVPAGEPSKSWETLIPLVERLIDLQVERSDHLVALGGGVVGDLAGFAASILKRGCRLVHVPTTLLAQVDSAIGGKSGINSESGKNLIGAFHQPAAVLIDPECLDTLPPRELRAGYAEIVKYGLIGDPDFFTWCQRRGRQFLAGDPAARIYAIKASVEAKARIVAADERETSGRRALLNLGHTFGHALEAETGFSDRLLHGEAVAIGTVLAFRFSVERGLCPSEEAERVAVHFTKTGLPTELRGIDGIEARSLVARMENDKKAEGGRMTFILAERIGRAFVDRTVSAAEVEAFLDSELQRPLPE